MRAPDEEPTSAPPAQRSGPITLGSHEFFAAGAIAEEVSAPNVPRPITMANAQPGGRSSSRDPADQPAIVVTTSTPAWVVTGLVIVITAVLFLELRSERAERGVLLEAHAAALAIAEEKAKDAVISARADAAEKDVRIKLLEREVGTLTQEKRSQEAELARLKAMEEDLRERVSSEIIAGDIELIQQGSRLSVDVVDKLLFASGESEVSPRGREVLTKIGAVLAKLEDRNVQVVGHTDDSPPSGKVLEKFPTNWELSVSRATNVVRFLQEEAKVPGKRLVAIGRGQHQPIATNVNSKGRARNRRIEILLTPLEETVAAK